MSFFISFEFFSKFSPSSSKFPLISLRSLVIFLLISALREFKVMFMLSITLFWFFTLDASDSIKDSSMLSTFCFILSKVNKYEDSCIVRLSNLVSNLDSNFLNVFKSKAFSFTIFSNLKNIFLKELTNFSVPTSISVNFDLIRCFSY